MILSVNADADHAAASNDRRSVSGVAFTLGDTAIIGWKSGTEKCVTAATCEADYVALCDASKEMLLNKSCFGVSSARGVACEQVCLVITRAQR